MTEATQHTADTHPYIYTYMYACIYVCVYTYMYIYMCVCVHIHVYTYVYMYICAYTCVYTRMCVYTYRYVYMCVHIYMYVYMCVYTCVCVCVYVYLRALCAKLLIYIYIQCEYMWGFPGRASGKEPVCQCRRCRRPRFNPWVRKIAWRRKWQPTSGFLPGKSHGQRSLVDYSPWSCKESGTTEAT